MEYFCPPPPKKEEKFKQEYLYIELFIPEKIEESEKENKSNITIIEL